MAAKPKNKQSVAEWILDKVNTQKWRSGQLKGCKHYTHKDAKDSLLEMMEAVGSSKDFMQQVNELERLGLITVKYGNVRTTVEDITISMEQIDKLYKYCGRENEKDTVTEYKALLEKYMKETSCEWLISYEEALYKQLEKGTIDINLRDNNILKLLNAIAELKGDVWKRKFSRDVLGTSKEFENNYEDKIITVLVNYSDKVEDDIKEAAKANESGIKDIVLAEHGIMTYSQTLQWKGGIIYAAGNGNIDTSLCPYGTIINASSLAHAKLISLKEVRKIVTIENQANYENMIYDSQILYIFTHGFLSPKERRFLLQIADMADENVEFFHWSDLDYGGIRIFNFMKQKVFKKVQPLYMDRATYEFLLDNTDGIAFDDKKRKKLEKIECNELLELKQCILRHGKEFEQEALIGMEGDSIWKLLNFWKK